MFLLASCHQTGVFEAKDEGLRVLLRPLESNGTNDTERAFSARLIPSNTIMSAMDGNVKTDLAYRMDSCFYFEDERQKYYPDLVQAVASGSKNSFEYLVSFSESGTRGELFYHDKFLTHKVYRLKPIKE
jgi:hypothetical protein